LGTLPLRMVVGRTCQGASNRPRPSQGQPQARPALGVLARRWLPTRRPESTSPGLIPYVANVISSVSVVSDVCFKCFHMDVAKVERDVAYVVSVSKTCCKLFCSQCFICFLDVCCKCVYLDAAYVSHVCCKCFMWMLRIFYNGFKCF
jgi:hypothetical protein